MKTWFQSLLLNLTCAYLKALKRLDLYGNPNLAANLPEAVQRQSRTRGGVCDIRR
jgi:hypothetical protein